MSEKENQKNTGAKKNDDGKPPLAIVPSEPLKQVSKRIAVMFASMEEKDYKTYFQSRLWLVNSALNVLGEYLNNENTYDRQQLPQAAAFLMCALEQELKPGEMSFVKTYGELFSTKESPTGAAPLVLIPRNAFSDLAKVLGFGAKKYGMHNFKSGFGVTRVLSAVERHCYSYLDYVLDDKLKLDPESGVHHLGHAIAGLFMAMECQRIGTLTDDRYVPDQSKEVVK